jgi:hypothetical protein
LAALIYLAASWHPTTIVSPTRATDVLRCREYPVTELIRTA